MAGSAVIIGTGYDADDTSIGPIVGVSDERLEEFQVFAEHFGPIVDGEDVDDGGQQADSASVQVVVAGTNAKEGSHPRRAAGFWVPRVAGARPFHNRPSRPASRSKARGPRI